MTVRQIDGMDEGRFVETLGAVFENSEWLARGAWRGRPFASLGALHERMVAEVDGASREQRLEMLRAHPDLGTRARMSASSQSEQTGAGLDAMPEADYNRLLGMNAEYREKFGFPFIYAVRGSTRAAVLEALERRLKADPEDEFNEALAQVCRIARFRLDDIIA